MKYCGLVGCYNELEQQYYLETLRSVGFEKHLIINPSPDNEMVDFLATGTLAEARVLGRKFVNSDLPVVTPQACVADYLEEKGVKNVTVFSQGISSRGDSYFIWGGERLSTIKVGCIGKSEVLTRVCALLNLFAKDESASMHNEQIYKDLAYWFDKFLYDYVSDSCFRCLVISNGLLSQILRENAYFKDFATHYQIVLVDAIALQLRKIIEKICTE